MGKFDGPSVSIRDKAVPFASKSGLDGLSLATHGVDAQSLCLEEWSLSTDCSLKMDPDCRSRKSCRFAEGPEVEEDRSSWEESDLGY